MLIILVLAMGFQGEQTPEKYPLIYENTRAFNSTRFVFIASENLFMVNDGSAVYIFRPMESEPTQKLKMPDKWMAGAGIGWIPGDRLYAVTGYNPDNIHAKKTPTHRVFFFTENGQPLVEASTPEWNYVRQFIPVDSRLFLNNWERHMEVDEEPPVLREVVLNPEESGYAFKELGIPFSRQFAEARAFNNNFKMRWIVDDKSKNQLIVADELQPRLWIYQDTGASNYVELEHVDINLEHRSLPYRWKSEDETFDQWYYSFSTTTGFYNFEDGYVISYTIPVRNSEKYSKNSQNITFVLCLARLDGQFKRIGKTLQMPDQYMLGAGNHSCYILDVDEKTGEKMVNVINDDHFLERVSSWLDY